jgi:hypothetical protein
MSNLSAITAALTKQLITRTLRVNSQQVSLGLPIANVGDANKLYYNDRVYGILPTL